MGEYGRHRGNQIASQDGSDSDGWLLLGDHRGRFESQPPDGVFLTRSQRRALALINYTAQQAETRTYGGRRIYG